MVVLSSILKKKAIIIGSGFAGLSAASFMAKPDGMCVKSMKTAGGRADN